MKETTYWKSRTLRDYYRKLTPSSDETAVDVLWTNSLRVHFPLEGYGIEAQTHPAKKSSKKCNIVVSSFQGQGLKRVLVIENKRRKFEGSSAVWTEAVQKVTDYLLLARAQQPDVPRYFAIVNVGLYSRFYKLAEKEPVLVPLEGEENPPLPLPKG